MEKRQVNVFADVNGNELVIGKFGTSTQAEFDSALAALPALIKKSRCGDTTAGDIANAILWALANEGSKTNHLDMETFGTIRTFGNEEKSEKYKIMTWYDDEDGEGEEIVDEIKAYTEAHAKLILRNGVNKGKYPKGAWVRLAKGATA